ncbi:MAG: GFA family protein [Pseudomonadota bacterium]
MGEQSGSCSCGAVTFLVTGPMREVVYCHCTQCRKQTGNYVGATRADDTQLHVEGADNITWYAASDEAQRGFCKICGSSLFWKRQQSDRTSIMAGTFDNPTNLKSGFHIYCADKGDYYEISDGLPQHPGAD